MRAVARRQYELYLEVLTATWGDAAARAGVTLAVPVDDLARMFLAGVDGLILQYLTLGDRERTRADLEAFLDQILRYAAPQPSAAASEPRPASRRPVRRTSRD
jgi:hypothetical protein